MVNRFILNEVSYFGPGARRELPGVVSRLGFNKALVVTDKGLMRFGVAGMVLDVMDQAGIRYEVFDDVKPNPTVTNVKGPGPTLSLLSAAVQAWILPRASVL